MKLNENLQLPIDPESAYDKRLYQVLYKFVRDVAIKVNQIGSGQILGSDLIATSAPTAGSYFQGDQIKNSQPTELGAAGSRYVVLGWICTVSGSPGTFREMRVLTGN